MELVDFLQRHIYVSAIAGVSGLSLLALTVGRGIGAGPRTGVSAAVQLMNRSNALVLDVREPVEFAAGHIIGARNIPLGRLAERRKEIERYKARPVILVCQSGARAGKACGELAREGFAEASVLDGGMAAWQQAGMPVERAAEAG